MAIQIHISRRGETSVQEQIRVQIVLGIFSGDLRIDEKLPSRRELASALKIHQNTVSAAYRDLAGRGWIEYHEGQGFYVRPLARRPISNLNRLIASLLESIHRHGFTLAEVETRLRQLLVSPETGRVLVIEPDADLREILVCEIAQATGLKVAGADFKQCSDLAQLRNTVPVVMYARAAQARAKLPAIAQPLLLRANSVAEAMRREPLPRDAQIAVVSRCDCWRRMAQAFLEAAGYDTAALNFCDTRECDWRRRALAGDFVLADACVAALLPVPTKCQIRIFRIISNASLTQLRGLFAPSAEDA